MLARLSPAWSMLICSFPVFSSQPRRDCDGKRTIEIGRPPSAADLTFAALLTAILQSERQIQSSTRILKLLVVFRFQHSQKRSLKRDANVGIGPLVQRI